MRGARALAHSPRSFAAGSRWRKASTPSKLSVAGHVRTVLAAPTAYAARAGHRAAPHRRNAGGASYAIAPARGWSGGPRSTARARGWRRPRWRARAFARGALAVNYAAAAAAHRRVRRADGARWACTAATASSSADEARRAAEAAEAPGWSRRAAGPFRSSNRKSSDAYLAALRGGDARRARTHGNGVATLTTGGSPHFGASVTPRSDEFESPRACAGPRSRSRARSRSVESPGRARTTERARQHHGSRPTAHGREGPPWAPRRL